MKILVRTDKNKHWNVADPVIARAEIELQHLLVESPSLIPISEIAEEVSPLVVSVDEFGLPGSGNTDVLAFTADGDIAVVECKLAANPESKRKVIGQIFEYAAYLWRMSYQELDRRVQVRRGRPLAELVEAVVAGGWDGESFREGVEECLERGAFLLIIVVDEINDELRRIIRYVNECSKSEFSLHALEIRRFKAAGLEILVPHLHGAAPGPTGDREKRKQWSEEQFFRVLGESVDTSLVGVIEDLYQWAKNTADRVWFGTGAQTGSFTFHYLRGNKTLSIFTIYTNGKLQLNYGWLSTVVPDYIMRELHTRITQISAFRTVPADFTKFPTLLLAEVSRSPENLAAFKQAVAWLREQKDKKSEG